MGHRDVVAALNKGLGWIPLNCLLGAVLLRLAMPGSRVKRVRSERLGGASHFVVRWAGRTWEYAPVEDILPGRLRVLAYWGEFRQLSR